MLCWAANDWKTAVAVEFLWDNFKIKLSEKGLYNIKKQLKCEWENRNPELDKEVDWNDGLAIQELSLISPQSQELKSYLFDVWEAIQYRLLTNPDPVTDPLPLTYRAIKWLGHMGMYYKEKISSLIDHIVIAEQYTVRDLLADCAKEDMSRADIDKWLILQPWSSKENMETYIRLVKGETIPPLNEDHVRQKADIAIESHIEDRMSDAIYGQGYRFLETGKKIDAKLSAHGASVDKQFDHEGAWRFLLPTQRSHKETIDDWLGEHIPFWNSRN